MTMSTANRRLFSALLITLFVSYYLNITLFPHSHHMGGVVIIHSHFYNGTTPAGDPAHSHTRSYLIIISDLSLFLTTMIILGNLVVALKPAVPFHSLSLVVKQTISFTARVFQPRAPPVLI